MGTCLFWMRLKRFRNAHSQAVSDDAEIREPVEPISHWLHVRQKASEQLKQFVHYFKSLTYSTYI